MPAISINAAILACKCVVELCVEMDAEVAEVLISKSLKGKTSVVNRGSVQGVNGTYMVRYDCDNNNIAAVLLPNGHAQAERTA